MTEQQLALTLLHSSKTAGEFIGKLEDIIKDGNKKLLSPIEVQNYLKMKSELEKTEKFFQDTHTSLVEIIGNNPLVVKSTTGSLLKDRDLFCNKANQVNNVLKKDKDLKNKLGTLESMYNRSLHILGRLEVVDPQLDFSELNWVGFKLFKAAYLGKINL